MDEAWVVGGSGCRRFRVGRLVARADVAGGLSRPVACRDEVTQAEDGAGASGAGEEAVVADAVEDPQQLAASIVHRRGRSTTQLSRTATQTHTRSLSNGKPVFSWSASD